MVRVKAIRVHELGGPQVLNWEEVEIGEAKEGEVRVRNNAVGVNFIDVYFRSGVYKAPPLPFTPGSEAFGVVIAVGVGVTNTKVGDVVAYVAQPLGSYAEEQIVPENSLVPVPPSIHPSVGAAILAKGMTTLYLLQQCFKVQPGHTILVHAAAGGLESILCQWAKVLGATVIGTVSSEVEATRAREDGCHHVIMRTEENFVTRVNQITSGIGIDAVYDSVGKDTYESIVREVLNVVICIQGSIACLNTRGWMVSFGQSSGAPGPVLSSSLGAKSLYLTRPSIMHNNITRDELLEAAGEVFAKVVSGVLNVPVIHAYPLSDAAQAHQVLENGNTIGSIVLLP
ncbi:2-haloacrylate reductase, partial [Mucuna pruriens]